MTLDFSRFPTSSTITGGIYSQYGGMTVGPDGNVWFTDSVTGAIGFVNPSTNNGQEFALPAGSGAAQGITAGPDGNIWFTDSSAQVGVYNLTTHAFSEFPLPAPSSDPRGIVAGPDGNLWFVVEQTPPQIGEIDPTTHAISEFPAPSAHAELDQIVAGPDGNLWFGEGGRIGKINPETHATSDYVAEADSGVAVGPDGEIWFTSKDSASIGEINPNTFAVSSFPIPGASPSDALPTALVTGSDGNIWVNDISYIDLVQVIPASVGRVESSVTGLGNAPLAGAAVYLDLKGDGKLDPGDPSAVTNSNGVFSLTWTPGTYTLRVVTYPGDIVTSPAGGSQSVTITGGQLTAPAAFTVVQTSVVLPLTLDPAPFGTSHDLATAEVTGLYNIILVHPPDPSGLAYWVAALGSGTPLSTLSTYLINTPEYDTGLILSYYSNLLDATPTAAAVNEWVGFMQAGMSVNQVVYHFMDTPEYNALHPDGASFIQSLYANFIGRSANSSEVSAWEGVLTAGATRGQAILAFIQSPYTAERELNGLYAYFPNRPPDASGLAFWTAALEAGTPLVSVAASFGSSPEFIQRAMASIV